jgi:hypothetical protein
MLPDRGTRKRIAYAKCHELYKKCPSKLAEVLLNGNMGELSWDPPATNPFATEFTRLYQKLWGSSGSYNGPTVEVVTSAGILFRIFPKDVSARLRKVKKGSAAGPDGVSKTDIMRITGHANLLAKWFSVILISDFYPDEWRRNRTTLIPKPGKDPNLAANYRPITVSSMISRIYSGILDGKLRSLVVLDKRQKGFVAESGCAVNCLILDTALRLARQGRVLVISQLNIRKAFDTVPHQGLVPELVRAGCPGELAEVIAEMYTGVTTSLGVDGSSLVSLKRVVKQGDPLFPLLFNLLMDPLIKKLSRDFPGFRIGDTSVSVLAFAGDLILLAGSIVEAQDQLNCVSEFLDGLGMSLSPDKNQAGQVVPLRKSWVTRDPGLSIKRTPVPGVKGTATFTYLGIDFSSAQVMCNNGHMSDLTDAAKRVRRLALKPRQKVKLIFSYLLPKFLYRWGIDTPPVSKTRLLDQELRTLVREILHLHPTTTNHIFYAKTKDGGLGLPQIGNAMRLAGLRAGIKMMNISNPVQKSVITEESMEWHMSK